MCYPSAKKLLKSAIKKRKKSCWEAIREDIDPEMMQRIVKALFPDHPERARLAAPAVMEEIELFKVEELRAAAFSMGNRKSPGPDGISTKVIKLITKGRPFLLLNMYNTCLLAGIFPKRWKVQRLVLLEKGICAPITLSSYKPLCMLDNLGKVYVKLLRKRLRTAVYAARSLAVSQHGFRMQRSTIRAIREVIRTAREAWQGNHRSRDACVLVTLDVKNAFNSARWADILVALEQRFVVPPYLLRVIDDYLQGRADDIAVTIRARSSQMAKSRVASITAIVGDWLKAHGLELADDKTKVVILTRQRRFSPKLALQISGVSAEAKEAVKYLCEIVDRKLTHWDHIGTAADKAEKMVALFLRLIPMSSKRRISMTVIHSILLYGVEIWADAMNV